MLERGSQAEEEHAAETAAETELVKEGRLDAALSQEEKVAAPAVHEQMPPAPEDPVELMLWNMRVPRPPPLTPPPPPYPVSMSTLLRFEGPFPL